MLNHYSMALWGGISVIIGIAALNDFCREQFGMQFRQLPDFIQAQLLMGVITMQILFGVMWVVVLNAGRSVRDAILHAF